ncbi:hypothetical protein [Lentzea albida]|uniref:Uncharacterized protein n=1 Tax=Lentzea albida TaxID=65499 RepID=A0A1H9BXH3_9PSEU|nr:hypothetical protein [Lentzea albida]SEP93665.1 hypothetical protein SAMN04488000_101727 [Lentzea albida]
MPRRRPLNARQLLQLPVNPYSAVRGMSSRLLADIRVLEDDDPTLWQGSVERALRLWTEYLHDPHRHLRAFGTGTRCELYECCGDPLEARHLLRRAANRLPTRTAKELRRFVARTAERHAA